METLETPTNEWTIFVVAVWGFWMCIRYHAGHDLVICLSPFFCGRFFYLLVIFIGFSSRVFHTFLLFIGLVRSKTYLVAYNTIFQCVLFIFDPPIRKYTVSDKLRHFFLCCSVVSFSPVCFRSNIFCINPLVHHLWTFVNRYHVNIFTRQWPSKGKTI